MMGRQSRNLMSWPKGQLTQVILVRVRDFRDVRDVSVRIHAFRQKTENAHKYQDPPQ